jgi:methyl-accepting chemotaxis protein
MQWQLPRLSIKSKIFFDTFVLALLIVAFNAWYAKQLVRKSAGKSAHELQGVYTRYQSFQRSYAHGMAVAASAWAMAPQLRAAFASGNVEGERPIEKDVQESLNDTIHPDFVILVDKHGEAVATGAIELSATRSMRALMDLRAGLNLDEALLEHKGRAYLVAGAPVQQNGEVVGALLVGVHLERVFTEFKQQTDDDPKKQPELAVVHNSRTTASAAHADDWDDIARATRPEQRETVQDGDDRITVVELPDGPHDFFGATVNGYDGTEQGSVGNLYLLRNRVDRAKKIENLIRDTTIVGLFAMLLATGFAFGISIMVTHPIRQMIAATADLAHGSGDLTKRLQVHRRAGHEMQDLADNLNQIFGKLQTLAAEVQGASFQVGASSAEISAASKQMLGGAKDQATRIESSTAAVTELSRRSRPSPRTRCRRRR